MSELLPTSFVSSSGCGPPGRPRKRRRRSSSGGGGHAEPAHRPPVHTVSPLGSREPAAAAAAGHDGQPAGCWAAVGTAVEFLWHGKPYDGTVRALDEAGERALVAYDPPFDRYPPEWR